jgi:serine protease Do
MRTTLRGAAVALFLGAGVAGGLVVARAFDARSEAAAHVRPNFEPPAALASLQDSFHAVAEAVMPSVVHITTQAGGSVDWWMPQGVGSGVIVSGDGHILTNNHVVDAGDERTKLRVRFSDGREFPARIVGRDSETDLALLKIEVPRGKGLAPISFGDSDKVRVGDWCLAIGSPFGYNHTMTAGIVSAKHRRAQITTPYQDFIQTDAAINPGNSGGALVNIRGELIGINTAIVSETRGSDGVGLAISSNLVRFVRDALLKEGRVRRGYLGVRPVDFTQELVDALREEYGIKSLEELLRELEMKEARGVYLYTVEKDKPAERGGVRERDVLVEFNGEPVNSQSDLLLKVAKVAPGTPVTLKVLRSGKEQEFKVELGERPPIDLRRPPRRR